MKIIFIILALFFSISCSHTEKSESVAPTSGSSIKTEEFQIPDYTGKWVADGDDGDKWYLNIIEMPFQKPLPSFNEKEPLYFAKVAAVLKVEYPPNKNPNFPRETIYSLSGERIVRDRLLLGTGLYEEGSSYPIQTWVLKFLIPPDLNKGITAWFESARTGFIPNLDQKHEEVKNTVIKLKFKRE